MIIKNANVFRNASHRFEKCDVRVENGVIAEIGSIDATGQQTFDATGKWIVSGLVDVHTHGRAGFDFIDATEEQLHTVAKDFARHGVTAVMPTLASAPLAEMYAASARMTEFSRNMSEASFCGVHLEGRYLCPQKRGAHALSLIAPLDPRELESEVFRMCRSLHISAAYERDTDGAFSKKALEIGATLGLGHTSATYDEAVLAEQRGVSSYTHLFNTMPPLAHRDGGAVCAALTGKCFAEIICDGIHIKPEMIRLAYAMLGSDRLVLISDSMQATGCPDGEYAIAGMPVNVKDGIARTPDGALAGSTLTLDVAVNNLIDFCGISLEDAITCATENPARQMGVYDSYGSVDVGKRADMLLLGSGDRLLIEKIMINGSFI